VLRPGLAAEPDELIEVCKQVLAKFKVPRAVFIEASLPRTPMGKIAKPVLRERVSPTTRGGRDGSQGPRSPLVHLPSGRGGGGRCCSACEHGSTYPVGFCDNVDVNRVADKQHAGQRG
jgi:hypothetical protein